MNNRRKPLSKHYQECYVSIYVLFIYFEVCFVRLVTVPRYFQAAELLSDVRARLGAYHCSALHNKVCTALFSWYGLLYNRLGESAYKSVCLYIQNNII